MRKFYFDGAGISGKSLNGPVGTESGLVQKSGLAFWTGEPVLASGRTLDWSKKELLFALAFVPKSPANSQPNRIYEREHAEFAVRCTADGPKRRSSSVQFVNYQQSLFWHDEIVTCRVDEQTAIKHAKWTGSCPWTSPVQMVLASCFWSGPVLWSKFFDRTWIGLCPVLGAGWIVMGSCYGLLGFPSSLPLFSSQFGFLGTFFEVYFVVFLTGYFIDCFFCHFWPSLSYCFQAWSI